MVPARLIGLVPVIIVSVTVMFILNFVHVTVTINKILSYLIL